MGIQGTGLTDKNARLRFFGVVFMGIVAFGAVLYWRQAALSSAEYVEPPAKHTEEDLIDSRSSKYQLEVIEVSPSVR